MTVFTCSKRINPDTSSSYTTPVLSGATAMPPIIDPWSSAGAAGSFTVVYTLPTFKTDETALSGGDIGANWMYYGTTRGQQRPGGSYLGRTALGAAVTSGSASSLTAGTYFVAFTTEVGGVESYPSHEFQLTVT